MRTIMIEPWVASTIALVGAIVLTAISYPLLIWLICKFHRN